MYKKKENQIFVYSQKRKKIQTTVSYYFDWENNSFICGLEADKGKHEEKIRACWWI